LRPSDERAEVHRFQRGPPEDVRRRAVERTADQLEYQAPTLHRPLAGEPEAPTVESRSRIHPLQPPGSIGELVEVESGRDPRLVWRRPPPGEPEAAGERRRDRVARERTEVHLVDASVAQLVGQGVAQGDATERGDAAAAGQN